MKPYFLGKGVCSIKEINTSSHSSQRLAVTEQVYLSLRDQIVNMRILPNQLILVHTLANTMEVSRTAVREALIRLQDEGLVCSGAGKKFYVAPLDQKIVTDYFEARLVIECYCAKILAQKITSDQLEQIFLALEAFEKVAEQRDTALHFQYDHKFHTTLIDLAGNSIISRWMKQSSNTYQRIRVALHNEAKLSDTIFEHRNIYKAISAGNESAAQLAITEHIKNTIKNSIDASIKYRIF